MCVCVCVCVLCLQPAFRDADRSKKSLALYIAKGKVGGRTTWRTWPLRVWAAEQDGGPVFVVGGTSLSWEGVAQGARAIDFDRFVEGVLYSTCCCCPCKPGLVYCFDAVLGRRVHPSRQWTTWRCPSALRASPR